jgi:GxxExxY protein
MLVLEELTERIIGCGIEVHRHLGPGLSEAVYEEALAFELGAQGFSYARQIGIPVTYKGVLIGEYRPDLVVADAVIVEVKSVERLTDVHRAQTLMYMRLLKVRVGLLMNFNREVLRTGIRRLVL